MFFQMIQMDGNRLTGNMDTLLHSVDVRSLCKSLSFCQERDRFLWVYNKTENLNICLFSIFCGQSRSENYDSANVVHRSSVCKWELRSVDRQASGSIPNILFQMPKAAG